MSSVSLQPLHVILADGDKAASQVTCSLLEECGFKVTEVSDGKVALELLEANASMGACPMDVVLTDVTTAGLNGLEFLERIQRLPPGLSSTPVVIMSGDPSSQELVLRCLGAGACECLVKPIRRHDLEGLWKHSWRRNASLPLRSLSGYWTTSSGPAPAVSISIADKLQVSVKGDENSSPRMPPVLHLPMGRGFKGGGSDGGSDTSSRDRQSAHPWNGSGDKGSGSTENTDSGEDEAPKPSTSLPAGQQGGPRGPVSVLPRGLQELAQLGNLREAEQRNHRGLKSHQQKAAAALRHSNSCSAFSAFASIDDANRTSSAAELQYQEAAHFQPPSFFSPPQQNPRLQIVPSLLISGWGGLPGGFGPGLGAPPLVHPAITSLYEQIMHNMCQSASLPDVSSSAPSAPAVDNASGEVNMHRQAALAKFREKRKIRNFDRKVRYESRKRLAEERPRVRGQFVKRTDVSASEA